MRRRHLHALLAAAAATLALGALSTTCGGEAGSGYIAVGAAGSAPGEDPTTAEPPTGSVVLVPLDGTGTVAGAGSGTGTHTGPASTPGAGGSPAAPATPGRGSGRTESTENTGSAGSTGNTGSSTGAGTDTTGPSPSPPGTATTPATPAALTVSAPQLADAGQRWCEKVTVRFRNTGGSPVRSGTVSFATHIIGALGVDWATIESAQPLPAPIGAGAAETKTYTVCVESWRVPLGMHIDTRAVTASWK
jgi:hypothetical protein